MSICWVKPMKSRCFLFSSHLTSPPSCWLMMQLWSWSLLADCDFSQLTVKVMWDICVQSSFIAALADGSFCVWPYSHILAWPDFVPASSCSFTQALCCSGIGLPSRPVWWLVYPSNAWPYIHSISLLLKLEVVSSSTLKHSSPAVFAHATADVCVRTGKTAGWNADLCVYSSE